MVPVETSLDFFRTDQVTEVALGVAIALEAAKTSIYASPSAVDTDISCSAYKFEYVYDCYAKLIMVVITLQKMLQP